jgi:threonine dehydrogenase-like Zn-dependent dehydrogenase
MRISEVYGPRHSRIVETDKPAAGVNDVLVRVRACGICGSEYRGWNLAENPPLRLGHEVSGEVLCVGAGVSGIVPGDHVTGLFREGFAEFAVAPSRSVMKYPGSLGFEEASLGEPVSCVVSGALRTDIGLGKTVAVIGLGFMGLLMLQLLKLRGACRLIAIDSRRELSKVALRYGADEFYVPGDVPTECLLLESGGSGGVDVVAECTGNEQALALAITMLKRHSVLSVVGYHQGGPRLVDFQMLNWKAIDIVNAHEKRVDFKLRCMKIGLDLVVKGQLDIASLMTHYYSLETIDAAFEDFGNKPGGYVKGVVRIER